ncbi:MAG: TolC family protein [Gammaproteobacteria bacterium]
MAISSDEMRELAIALVIGLISPVALAADAQLLRLSDAITRALAQNNDYLNLLSSIEGAELDLEDARSEFRRQFYTRLDSDARVGSELGKTFRSGMSQRFEGGSSWNLEFYNSDFGGNNLSEMRFSYSLPIFDDPLDSGTLDLRRAELDYQHRERLATVGSEELIAQVASHYYQSVLARDSLQAADGETTLAKALANATRIRVRNGRSSALDQSAAELRVAQANQRWNTARSSLVSADNRLKIMLGMNIDEPFEIDPELPAVSDPSENLPEPEVTEALALANRAELLRLGEEIDLARRKLQTEPESRLPGLDVTLQFARVGEGEGFGDSMDLNENRVGIGLSMDMDVNGRRDITYRRILLFYKQRQRDYNRLSEDIRADVRNAVMNHREQVSQLGLARASLSLSEQRFKHAELLYRSGKSSTEDVLEREQALSESRQLERQARADYLIAGLEVKRVTGTLAKEYIP